MIEAFGYLASFCIGLILGLIGSGGSILSIPILIYLFSLEIVEATAYSLFIVGVTSLTGTIHRYSRSVVNFRIGLVFGIPSIAAIFCTRKWIVPAIPDILLRTESIVITKRLLILGILAILMIAAALVMIIRKADDLSAKSSKPQLKWLALQGILIGFLTGLVGVGGGFLVIPCLVFLAKIPFKSAVGTALFIIAINSLLGFAGDMTNYSINWSFLLVMASIAIGGIFVGNMFAQQLASHRLKRVYGLFILVMGVFILVKESLY